MRRWTFATVALTALLAAQAAMAQDHHHLATHADWSVYGTVTAEGTLECMAGTENHAGEAFVIVMDPAGDTTIRVFSDLDVAPYSAPVDFVIPGVKRWELDAWHVNRYGGQFTFDSQIAALKFTLDIQAGTSISIASPGSDDLAGGWSLNGSKLAVDGLFECFEMIAGEGV